MNAYLPETTPFTQQRMFGPIRIHTTKRSFHIRERDVDLTLCLQRIRTYLSQSSVVIVYVLSRHSGSNSECQLCTNTGGGTEVETAVEITTVPPCILYAP